MVQVFMYEKIEYKNNKHLVPCIYLLTIKIVHYITEIPKDCN